MESKICCQLTWVSKTRCISVLILGLHISGFFRYVHHKTWLTFLSWILIEVGVTIHCINWFNFGTEKLYLICYKLNWWGSRYRCPYEILNQKVRKPVFQVQTLQGRFLKMGNGTLLLFGKGYWDQCKTKWHMMRLPELCWHLTWADASPHPTVLKEWDSEQK